MCVVASLCSPFTRDDVHWCSLQKLSNFYLGRPNLRLLAQKNQGIGRSSVHFILFFKENATVPHKPHLQGFSQSHPTDISNSTGNGTALLEYGSLKSGWKWQYWAIIWWSLMGSHTRQKGWMLIEIQIFPIQEPEEMFPTWLSSWCAPRLQVEGTQNLSFECFLEALIKQPGSFYSWRECWYFKILLKLRFMEY